jgi:hypothetical protein
MKYSAQSWFIVQIYVETHGQPNIKYVFMWLVYPDTRLCVLEDGLDTVDGKYCLAIHAVFSKQTYSVTLNEIHDVCHRHLASLRQ